MSIPEHNTPYTLEQVELDHIVFVLNETTSFTDAAALMGIDLTTLYRKRKRYCIARAPDGQWGAPRYSGNPAPFEGNNLCDCQSCGRYLRDHVGSTPCCGALAAVIYDGKKIPASADKHLKSQGWTRLKTPVGHCWYNPDHASCEDGNVIHEDEDLAEILYPKDA